MRGVDDSHRVLRGSYLLKPLDDLDLVHGAEQGREAAVHAENPVVNKLHTVSQHRRENAGESTTAKRRAASVALEQTKYAVK
jgi:hypothetical protein